MLNVMHLDFTARLKTKMFFSLLFLQMRRNLKDLLYYVSFFN